MNCKPVQTTVQHMPSMAAMTNITVTIIRPFQITRQSITKYKARHDKKANKFTRFFHGQLTKAME